MTVRVVVADDEPIGRHRLVRLLQAEPDTDVVATCADGEEAVAAIREQAPDIVLLDIQMPHLDGFEVARRLRQAEGAGANGRIAGLARGRRDRGGLRRKSGYPYACETPR